MLHDINNLILVLQQMEDGDRFELVGGVLNRVVSDNYIELAWAFCDNESCLLCNIARTAYSVSKTGYAAAKKGDEVVVL